MVGVLGGTFDPVHHGHLRLAVEMREALGLDEVRLVPAREPPHRRSPLAAAEDRLAMLEAAVTGASALTVDRRELDRPGPSYTVDTLASMRRELGPAPLWLCLGMDAFRALDTWHRWQELPGLAHLAVARRPGGHAPRGGPVADLLRERRIGSPGQARGRASGAILVLDVPALDISATRIRSLVTAGRDPRWLAPDGVLAVIRQRGLYLARP
jgi:nicotinate-nucleotide adenylyltransferase